MGGPQDSGVTSCSGGQLLCGGMCINPATSQAHCGRCNNLCTGNTGCVSGSCQSTMMTTDGGTGDVGMGGMCASGLTQCPGACRDLNFDANHCGACNRACPSGNYCDRGTCRPDNMTGDGGMGGDGGMCGAGQTVCSGVCRDLNTDTNHCGGCNRVCPSGNRCDNGSCVFGGGGIYTNCGGAQVVLFTDPLHCGGCNVRCSTGQLCISGTCTVTSVCTMGLTRCGSICTSTDDDPRHCGGCNRPCSGGQNCETGVCR